MSDVILRAENLKSGYDAVPVLHGVEMSIAAGEAVGLIGHNGMGKTTLLRALAGLQRISGGALHLGEREMSRASAARRGRAGIAYVPQGRGIFSELSVRDNLRLALGDAADEDEAIADLLRELPALRPLLERRAGSLSGGEQQQLALARALAPSPSLLLLDEPTEGIQPSVVADIKALLKRVNSRDGRALLLVEQNLRFVADVCTRVYVMARGVIVAECSGAQAKDARHLESYLGLSDSAAAPATAAPPPATAVPTPATPDAAPAPTAAVTTSPVPSPRNSTMPIKRPTLDQMRSIAEEFGMQMSDDTLQEYLHVMEGTLQAYDLVDSLPDNLPPVTTPRTPGRRPAADENPLNAWYIKCSVKGAAGGALAGKKIVLKDNICLAGVPMMNGASTLEGYVPDVDATLVQRILDAGGEIVGKAHCEYFCLSGGSHTNATGAVHNPYRLGYSAGGSSSGCGALVGAGEVEMAIGGDQGGSIRIPSCWCGCYGMKGTHGLVPYTGVFPIESTIDTAGPITRTVSDNALLLDVIAGADGLDPRQYAPRTASYSEALRGGVAGLRVGIVREGFSHPGSEEAVSAKVRQAAQRLQQAGAVVSEIALPMHRQGAAIWTPIALEGLVSLMMDGNAAGNNYRGLFVTGMIDAHSSWRRRADELSPSLKISMFIGKYFLRHYHGRYYGKAQNLARRLRAAYDDALGDVDLLLMPTLPMKPTPLPPPDAPLSLYIQRAFEMIPNTAPFSCTGHPAMNVPCGLVDGLPVGMMLVGNYYDEGTIYRAAYAFEQFGDWRGF